MVNINQKAVICVCYLALPYKNCATFTLNQVPVPYPALSYTLALFSTGDETVSDTHYSNEQM